MGSTIDQRVVEMQFRNEDFERNINTSLNSIDRLKTGLNMSGAAKGFEAFGSSVEGIKVKFSALQTIAMTALANITNSVINTGKHLVSSLAIQPITEGFKEYELKMGSVQTIMASTGASLETVNKYLADLNTYSDKTIYSFRDMTSNIGKFTNAGVDLETAVMAIKGVSNEAAVSGANAQEASRAMYNFSQALSAGYVKLIDWKSIENANMATVEFKNKLLETAVAVGTVEKTADGMYKVLTKNSNGKTMKETISATRNFNDSLSHQWMTTEVLTKTLRDYADETTEIGKKAMEAATKIKTFTMLMDTLKEAVGSGWAQTFEIIFGDFNEASELWTKLGDVIGGFISKTSDARNGILQTWKNLGGRDAMIQGFSNLFQSLLSMIKPVKEAFENIFPPKTVTQLGANLVSITRNFKEFASHLKISDETADKLKRTFQGVFSIFDIVGQVISGVAKIFVTLVTHMFGLSDGVFSITARIGDAITAFRNFINESKIISTTVDAIVKLIELFGTGLKNVQHILLDKFAFPALDVIGKGLKGVVDRIGEVVKGSASMGASFGDAVSKMREKLEKSGIENALTKIRDGLIKIGSGVVNKVIPAIGEGFGKIFSSLMNGNFNNIFSMIESFLAGGVIVKITKLLNSFADIASGAADFAAQITSILDGVRGSLQAYQNQLKAKTLVSIATAIAILAGSLFVISNIPADRMAAALAGITGLMGNLAAMMVLFNKFGGISNIKSYSSMILMATAVTILAGALKKIGDLNLQQMAIGLTGITVLMGDLVGAAMLMSLNKKAVIKGAGGMILFAKAIKILGEACVNIAQLSWEGLAKGLAGVSILIGEIALFLNFGNTGAKTIASATGILILSQAIKELAKAAKTFGEFSVEELVKGISAIGVLLAEIAIFTKLSSGSKNMIAIGAGMVILSQSLKTISQVVKDFGSMSIEQISNGLVALAGSLASVAVAMNIMPKNMPTIGLGMIAVSQALKMMAEALEKNAVLSWEQVSRGLTAMGGSLAIVAIGVNAMKGALPGVTAMMGAAVAIGLLTPALTILSKIPVQGIAVALGALAGTFVIFGIAGMALAPIVPVILALAAAFAIFNIGVLAMGTGLLAASAGMLQMSAAMTAMAAASTVETAAFIARIKMMTDAIVGSIPYLAVKLAEGIAMFLKGLADNVIVIGQALKTLLLEALRILEEAIPEIVDGVLKLIDEVLKSLVSYAPSIIDSVMTFLIEVINGVGKRIPELVDAAVTLITNFYGAIGDAVMKLDTSGLIKAVAGTAFITALIVALASVAAMIPQAMLGLLGVAGFIAEMILLVAAIGAFAQLPGLSWLVGEGGKMLEQLGNAIGKFVGGFVGGIFEGISNSLVAVADNLTNFINHLKPFIEESAKIDATSLQGVKMLAEVVATFTTAALLDGITKFITGGSALSQFGEELAKFGPAMKSYSDSIAGLDSNLVVESATAAEALATMAQKLPNEGGVLGYWVGENSLASFAEGLVPFGKSITEYAASVTGLDAGVVQNSANAASAMAELANKLPSSGGVFTELFGGKSDMKAFGDNLASFGKSFSLYYESIKGIDVYILSSATTEFGKLIDLSKKASGIDTTGLSGLGKSLKELGKNSVDGFIAQFTEASAKVNTAIDTMINSISSSITAKQPTIQNNGASLAEALSTGVSSKTEFVISKFTSMMDSISKAISDKIPTAVNAMNNLLSSLLTAIYNKYTEFHTAGCELIVKLVAGIHQKDPEAINLMKNIITNLLDALKSRNTEFEQGGRDIVVSINSGMTSKTDEAKSTMANLLKDMYDSVKDYDRKFEDIGRLLVKGITKGIRENAREAIEAARDMARAVDRASRDALDIHSPSRKFYEIGKFVVKGFVNSINDNLYLSDEAGRNLGESSMNGIGDAIQKISDVINSDMDFEPTIRPVLDLSNVKSGVKTIHTMLSMNKAYQANTSIGTNREVENSGQNVKTGNVYQFTQNNYSPKALSRIDIYRQTRNQFANIERASTI
nr:MAG TPA: tail tape measure [Caudoviricetes sp.]